jgi:peptide chain release factor 2
LRRLTSSKKRSSVHGGYFDLDRVKNEVKTIEYAMQEPDFWSEPNSARQRSQQRDDMQKELKLWEDISSHVEEVLAMAKEAEAEGEVSLKEDLGKRFIILQKEFDQLEFYILFSEKYDQRNAIVAIHAGTGGVDAQDWAAILLRMYLRFAERKGWVVKVVDESVGAEAGIKSVTFEVIGRYAYGYLKAEAGVHRLVRISPFDAEKMRHTSFALVEVLPELEEIEEVKIDDKDLRIDTFMSSGHGGQSVNTTYSAVRIVHLPTGITVSCQNERSQLQNKATAMKILKSKLHRIFMEERQEEKQKLRGAYQEAAWGNQARSYVMQPYKMVKDHRTKYEVSDVDNVLDGELDGFIEAYLRHNRAR